MATSIITPKSKSEIKAALTSNLDGYSFNYFNGEIRNGNLYARINHYCIGNKIKIHITYWQDGIDHAVDYASICSTPTGLSKTFSGISGLLRMIRPGQSPETVFGENNNLPFADIGKWLKTN